MNEEQIRRQNSDLGKSTVRGSDDPLVKVQPLAVRISSLPTPRSSSPTLRTTPSMAGMVA